MEKRPLNILPDTSDLAITAVLDKLALARAPAAQTSFRRQVQLDTSKQRDKIVDMLESAVITIFFGAPPPHIEQFKAAIGAFWGSLPGVKIREARSVGRGKFSTKFNSHAAQIVVLNHKSPTIKEVPSVTEPWSPEKEVNTYTPSTRPTWVELPELPVWYQDSLEIIFSKIGEVVRIPYVSQKFYYADVLPKNFSDLLHTQEAPIASASVNQERFLVEQVRRAAATGYIPSDCLDRTTQQMDIGGVTKRKIDLPQSPEKRPRGQEEILQTIVSDNHVAHAA
ncbi:hypothetical protein R1sor_025462 [Riccia sorocarpa]|uniref:RRM domain-containing protein n=1 Tax=Riccia sorocarpa TaxID=122646 RepID=A0ABD3GED2_9MARC